LVSAFFFQAEDGIRDRNVTGVQTCALPISLPHRDGSLAAALSVCADHEINLTEIHSRPLPETPWEYRFYIDLEGSLCDPAVRAKIGRASCRESVGHTGRAGARREKSWNDGR